jgi:hypothetical protein
LPRARSLLQPLLLLLKVADLIRSVSMFVFTFRSIAAEVPTTANNTAPATTTTTTTTEDDAAEDQSTEGVVALVCIVRGVSRTSRFRRS